MKRMYMLVLLVMAMAVAGASGHAPTRAMATSQAPTKIAVIIAENQDYLNVIGDSDFTYLNGLIGATQGGLSIDPTNGSCDYPAGDPQGAGTSACSDGMFQSFRSGSTGYLTSGSAPEYAWLSMGSDANIRDGTFPCGIAADDNTCSGTFTTANPEKGIAGYEPGHFDVTPPTSYDVFDVTNADAYAEDYPGTSSACSTVKWSDTSHNFYARKHNPLALSWNQMPDGVTNYTKGTPAVQYSPATSPGDSYCKAHMHDFPNNTPNATTEVATNFTGSESFGAVTYVLPSMCHMAHNGVSACRTAGMGCVTLDACGGPKALDRWLSMNLPGIRKDVGQTGVVVITFDENKSTSSPGTGLSPPVATVIVPGTDSSGTPGALTAGSGSYVHGLYDQSSTLRAILEANGSGCSALDDNAVYNNNAFNAVTAHDACTAAQALPLNVDVAPAGPALVHSYTAHSSTASTTASVTWTTAAPTGSYLVAAVGFSGAPTSVTAPSGWSLLKDKTKNVLLYACANCSRTAGQVDTWTANAAFNNVTIGEEWSGVSTTPTLDQTANNTSGSTNVTTADTGTTAATTTAAELVIGGLYNGAHSTFTNCSAGYNVVQDGQMTGSGIQIALLTQVVAATGTQNAHCDYATSDRMRGAIATVVY